MSSNSDSSRRNFIKRTSIGVPTLAFMLQRSSAAPASATTKEDPTVSDKFVPMDLTRQFIAAPSDFGPRERAKGLTRLCALKNPWPDRTLKSQRVESRDADPLVICGLTLFQGRENPLRYERLSLYRITLPDSSAADAGREHFRVIEKRRMSYLQCTSFPSCSLFPINDQSRTFLSVTVFGTPNVKCRQKKNAQDQRRHQAAHDDDRERALRIRPNSSRERRGQ